MPFQSGSGPAGAIAVLSVLVVLAFAALSTAVVLVRSERYVSGPGPSLDSAVPIRQPCGKSWDRFYRFFGRM